MQRVSFASELEILNSGRKVKKKPFSQIKPFIDNDGVVGCHGRLSGEKFESVNTPVLFS